MEDSDVQYFANDGWRFQKSVDNIPWTIKVYN